MRTNRGDVESIPVGNTPFASGLQAVMHDAAHARVKFMACKQMESLAIVLLRLLFAGLKQETLVLPQSLFEDEWDEVSKGKTTLFIRELENEYELLINENDNDIQDDDPIRN